MGENGAIKKLMKASLEGMLESKLTEHLGYEKYFAQGRKKENSRNGKSSKTIRNDNGEIEFSIPRDRNGSFTPIIVEKYQKTIGPIEDKIICYIQGQIGGR